MEKIEIPFHIDDDLLSFEAHFGLSAQEKEYLADCNYLLEICEVVICEEFVEVYGRRVE